jgi:hypothetical protein
VRLGGVEICSDWQEAIAKPGKPRVTSLQGREKLAIESAAFGVEEVK